MRSYFCFPHLFLSNSIFTSLTHTHSLSVRLQTRGYVVSPFENFPKTKKHPFSLSHAPFSSPRIWTGNAWCKYRFPWYLSHKEFRLANSVSLSHKKFDWPTQSVTQEILIDQKSLSHRKFCFDQLISLSRGKSFTRYSRVGRIPP